MKIDMKKLKYTLTAASFVLVIFGLAIWHIVLPDKDISDSERRKLAQAPEITAKAVLSREFSDDLESYLLDQFPMREGFRRLNAAFRFYILRQSDSNGMWLDDGAVYKNEPVTNLDQVRYAASLYNYVIDTYLQDCNVYYSVVPDKSFYAQDSGHPHLDYDGIISTMNDNVSGAQYVDITGALSAGSYYRTDTHWLQPELFGVLDTLGRAMGVEDYLTPEADYTSHTLSPFYGVYFQQAAVPVSPDSLTYLTSRHTDTARVSGPEYPASAGVYTTDKFTGSDGYDVFLGGPQMLITIECPDAKLDRELYIFRDSFGSSLVPLFTGAYSKITVIDLRYLPTRFLPEYVSFTPDSDVLFLNSTLVLNTAMIMR